MTEEEKEMVDPKDIEEEPKGPTIVDQAKEQADRLEEANRKYKELVEREEKLHVEKTLHGKAEVEPTKKEESAKDYADRVMANDIEERR